MKLPSLSSIFFLLGVLLAGPALATDEVFTSGPFEVRVTPFPSTFLTPELAKKYGLPRSETQAVLNLSVYDTRIEAAVKTVPAQLTGQHRNLIGQAFGLEFQTIDEGEAIYYVAPFRISDEEIMTFEIEALPEGARFPVNVRFNQKFYRQ